MFVHKLFGCLFVSLQHENNAKYILLRPCVCDAMLLVGSRTMWRGMLCSYSLNNCIYHSKFSVWLGFHCSLFILLFWLYCIRSYVNHVFVSLRIMLEERKRILY